MLLTEICRECSQLDPGSVVSQCNGNNVTAPRVVLWASQKHIWKSCFLSEQPVEGLHSLLPTGSSENSLLQGEHLSELNEMSPASAQYCQNHLPRQRITKTLEEANGAGAGFEGGTQAAAAGTAPLCSAQPRAAASQQAQAAISGAEQH